MKHHEDVLTAASQYGAVMFSGFEIKSGNEWSAVLGKTGIKEMPYIGGAAVRNLIVGNEERMNDMQIVTTNESPPSEPIPFHHELAQTPNPPSHINFYCLKNEAVGGSTPILRSDLVYDWLLENHPEFAKNAEEKGVKYVKVAPEEDDPSSALGRSWKSMYGVQTKEEALKAAAEQESTLEFLPGNDCRITSKVLPAVRVASNGNKAFFNQVVAAYTGWIDKRNELKKAVVFGDGTPLDDAVMTELVKFMNDHACAHRWVPGKFVIVDNTVTYHSRQTFKGLRKSLAAIGKGTKPVTDTTTHLVLKTGDRMPSVGLGLWKIPKADCENAVYSAIKSGYRLLDGACDYGNEVEVGLGIKKALDEGVCKREDLFIVSKLWNTFHRPEHVEEGCRKSLKDLGVDYLDLYIIHFPIAMKYVPIDVKYPPEWQTEESPSGKPEMILDEGVTYAETYKAMEQLVKKGLVRNIGCSNIGTSMLRQTLISSEIKPSVLQVELHPENTQEKLIRMCRENCVQVMAFSSFGASSYLELGMSTQDQCLLDNALIKELAGKYGKSAAQILLRWGVQRGTVVIPKSTNPTRQVENISLFDFNISDEDMQKISGLNKNKRYNDPGAFAEGAFGTFCPIYD